MVQIKIPMKKKLFILGIILFYIIFGSIVLMLVRSHTINKLPPNPINTELSLKADSILDTSKEKSKSENLYAAESFVNTKLLKENGHIDLYFPKNGKVLEEYKYTNSEAVSYYLLWNAKEINKQSFDSELNFAQKKMLEPKYGYLMWKLDSNDKAIDDDRNIASDADLRTIKALIIADSQWDDKKYKKSIDELAGSLEKIVITKDNLFAPYGGVRNGTIWKTEEVWLSYSDFTVFRDLAQKRKYPWVNVYNNMKQAVLKSQVPIGLYNSQIDSNGNYHNTMDNGYHSINSLWVMVRSAESGDKELEDSAKRALTFYKKKFEEDGALYASYDSNGNAVTKDETTWTYILVARTAIALKDKDFADTLINKSLERQTLDKTELNGAFLEGKEDNLLAGQFTMQEAIITLQDYVNSN